MILKGLKLWHWYYLYIYLRNEIYANFVVGSSISKCKEKYAYEFDVYINF